MTQKSTERRRNLVKIASENYEIALDRVRSLHLCQKMRQLPQTYCGNLTPHPRSPFYLDTGKSGFNLRRMSSSSTLRSQNTRPLRGELEPCNLTNLRISGLLHIADVLSVEAVHPFLAWSKQMKNNNREIKKKESWSKISGLVLFLHYSDARSSGTLWQLSRWFCA